jgi:hypothetical protein
MASSICSNATFLHQRSTTCPSSTKMARDVERHDDVVEPGVTHAGLHGDAHAGDVSGIRRIVTCTSRCSSAHRANIIAR